MDKRFIFRSHPIGAMGGRRWADTSAPSGHGACPAVARPGREIPRVTVRVGPRPALRRLESSAPNCREKPLRVEDRVPVPQTDTGRQVEDTKANERTLVKELGKLTPYLWKKGYPVW